MDEHESHWRSRIQRDRFSHNNDETNPSLWHKTWQMALIFFAVVICFLGSLFFFYVATAPKITTESLASDNSTKIYDNSGHLISRLGAENRDYASSKELPKNLKNGVVSIEDRHFYHDQGVDPVRIIKAGLSNLSGNAGIQGGSTLTQQLVKLSVFSTKASDRTMKRKAQEAWLALKVDHRYPKHKILEYYINKVYMGSNTYGMKTAAKYYYGKPLNKLTLSETALLAGMPQSPTLYNPYLYPKYARNRRNQVLNAMVNNHKISKAQADKAKKVSIKAHLVKGHHGTSTNYRHQKVMAAYLQQTIEELIHRKFNLHAGLKVYTTLNYKDQKKLYKLANTAKGSSQCGFPNNKLQIGSVLINAHNGKIMAMLGGRKNKISMGLNRAITRGRSSGSTIKPIMDYGPAIQDDYFPTYKAVQDSPFVYPGTNTKLMDFDHKYEGTISMRRALVESRNIPAIRTLQHVGIKRSEAFMKKLGITFKQKQTLQNGINAYISPLQEGAAFAAFANKGIYHRPYSIRKIKVSNGDTYKFHSKGHRAMSPATAFMMNNMLKGVMTNSKGSGTHAKIDGLNEAGKTGTTQYPDSYKGSLPAYAAMDSWMTGYTPNLVLASWTGYDNPMLPGHALDGNTINIVQKFYKYGMTYATRNQSNTDWHMPSDVRSIQKEGRTEYYVAGHPGDTSVYTSNSKAKKSATSDKDKQDKDTDNHSKSKASADSKTTTSNSDNSKTSSSTSVKTTSNNNTEGQKPPVKKVQ